VGFTRTSASPRARAAEAILTMPGESLGRRPASSPGRDRYTHCFSLGNPACDTFLKQARPSLLCLELHWRYRRNRYCWRIPRTGIASLGGRPEGRPGAGQNSGSHARAPARFRIRQQYRNRERACGSLTSKRTRGVTAGAPCSLTGRRCAWPKPPASTRATGIGARSMEDISPLEVGGQPA